MKSLINVILHYNCFRRLTGYIHPITMAEAFRENVSDNQDDEDLHSEEKPISVLLLATKWQFDTYGLSTVNKSLVNNLRVVDPEGKKIKITCAGRRKED